VAAFELVHRSLGKEAIHRLNAHELPLLSIQVGLEGPTIFWLDQQQSPGIAGAEDDLVDAIPRHGMNPQTVADLKAVRIGADVDAVEREADAARLLEEKCREFSVEGQVAQLNRRDASTLIEALQRRLAELESGGGRTAPAAPTKRPSRAACSTRTPRTCGAAAARTS
jgi:hypothetical protein